jgi:hypothetical protein
MPGQGRDEPCEPAAGPYFGAADGAPDGALDDDGEDVAAVTETDDGECVVAALATARLPPSPAPSAATPTATAIGIRFFIYPPPMR